MSLQHIVLCVGPTVAPLTKAEFLDRASGCSIALDGYVRGAPWYDETRIIANFNHHEDCDRMATRSTAAQVHMAIRLGLFRAFRDADGPRVRAFVNDCDEDVCMAWFLLSHQALSEPTTSPMLNRLVMMVDALDITAGTYPFPSDWPARQDHAWIFEPYRNFRLSGGLERKNAKDYCSIIEDVCGRIEKHVVGNGKQLPLDLRYERVGGGAGRCAWIMARETGAHAREAMFADGVNAYVAVRDGHQDGRYVYVVGRMSLFVPFPVPRILAALQAAEGETGNDVWGGSDIVGGSPRVGGSRLTPEDVARVIEECTR